MSYENTKAKVEIEVVENNPPFYAVRDVVDNHVLGRYFVFSASESDSKLAEAIKHADDYERVVAEPKEKDTSAVIVQAMQQSIANPTSKSVEESATDKLVKLGLTVEEVQSITGFVSERQ